MSVDYKNLYWNISNDQLSEQSVKQMTRNQAVSLTRCLGLSVLNQW